MGIGADTQVVAYDDSTGALVAARLWWLLKWAGHDAVSVLDGGFKRWKAAGLPCVGGLVRRPAGRFVPRFRPEMAMDAGQVLEAAADPAWIVLDARAAERFRGLNETIDPVAGHIKGARSAPYADNLAEDGCFKPVDELRARLDALAGARDSGHAVVYCGSGVTAAHLALAFARGREGDPAPVPRLLERLDHGPGQAHRKVTEDMEAAAQDSTAPL